MTQDNPDNPTTFNFSEEKSSEMSSPCGGFEGPEKRLSVVFRPRKPLDHSYGSSDSLRLISEEKWQRLLDFARCTIISRECNAKFTSYVLSESSLFVWPQKIMIKTCGTTTLLRILPLLMEYAGSMNLEFSEIVYSRKNYIFPAAQQHPHGHWDHEVDVLNETYPGRSFTFGCASGDHWRVFVASKEDIVSNPSSVSASTEQEILVEIMMQELSISATNKFYAKPGTQDKDKFPGIAELIPGSLTDEFNFTPCGYSMNGLADTTHWTIHVTPEQHCSYASFETNWPALVEDPTCFSLLMEQLCEIFEPSWIMIAVRRKGKITRKPSTLQLSGYVLQENNVAELGLNHTATCLVYRSEETSPIRPRKQSHLERCIRTLVDVESKAVFEVVEC